jgi:hypothetical protein
MAWLRGLPYMHRVEGTEVHLCHGSPVRMEDFDYIFAPEQARECLPFYDELGHLTLIGHSHLCKVFELTPTEVVELHGPPQNFDLRAPTASTSSRWAASGSRATTTTARATSLYDTKTREFCFKRVEYDIESAAQKIFDARLERNFGHRLFIGV